MDYAVKCVSKISSLDFCDSKTIFSSQQNVLSRVRTVENAEAITFASAQKAGTEITVRLDELFREVFVENLVKTELARQTEDLASVREDGVESFATLETNDGATLQSCHRDKCQRIFN